MLVERSGELVTRADITNRLWPHDIDVDVEQGLNHCIKEIRVALGDKPESPRYIQTLPRRGYRLITEVQNTGDPPAAAGASNRPLAAVHPVVLDDEAEKLVTEKGFE